MSERRLTPMTKKAQRNTPAPATPDVVDETAADTPSTSESQVPADQPAADDAPADGADKPEVELVRTFVVTHATIVGLGEPRRKGAFVTEEEISELELEQFLGDGTLRELGG
jgi:hypothetical protein